uniref:Uncharacterized protein n=1 Tax=Anopheles farauti TaxID=69004 RepID=A0A182QT08_9DIPT
MKQRDDRSELLIGMVVCLRIAYRYGELTSTELTSTETLPGKETGWAERRHLTGTGPRDTTAHATPRGRCRRQRTERGRPDGDVTGEGRRLCGVSARSVSTFLSELVSCWERGEQELVVVCEDRLAGWCMSPDGDTPGRAVVVMVVVVAVGCSIAWGTPCMSGLRGVRDGVGVVVVVLPEVMMAWCELGVLGRVSASSDATLKLLIRLLLFCCIGTVGLVIAIRTGVTHPHPYPY